jgi:hypothetical protein
VKLIGMGGELGALGVWHVFNIMLFEQARDAKAVCALSKAGAQT